MLDELMERLREISFKSELQKQQWPQGTIVRCTGGPFMGLDFIIQGYADVDVLILNNPQHERIFMHTDLLVRIARIPGAQEPPNDR